MQVSSLLSAVPSLGQETTPTFIPTPTPPSPASDPLSGIAPGNTSLLKICLRENVVHGHLEHLVLSLELLVEPEAVWIPLAVVILQVKVQGLLEDSWQKVLSVVGPTLPDTRNCPTETLQEMYCRVWG